VGSTTDTGTVERVSNRLSVVTSIDTAELPEGSDRHTGSLLRTPHNTVTFMFLLDIRPMRPASGDSRRATPR
jgi:hypothetical protein